MLLSDKFSGGTVKIMKKLFTAVAAFFALSAAVSAQSRKTEVWDFGGVADDGAVNHISISDLDSLDAIDETGKFSAGEFTFGDLTLKTETKDRAYYEGKKNYGTQGYTSFDFGDGYVSEGMYYCNGKGGEEKRWLLLKNVQAGDVITFYARTSNSGDEKIHFASVNDAGEKTNVQDETAPLSAVSTRYSYIAAVSGAYKVYAEANVGKPVYYRIVRTPGIRVSGRIEGLPSGSSPELKFIVKETNQELPSKISGNSFSAGLPAGHTFTALLAGVPGFGVTAQTKQLILEKDEKDRKSVV